MMRNALFPAGFAGQDSPAHKEQLVGASLADAHCVWVRGCGSRVRSPFYVDGLATVS